jgi:hypothetical protein
MIRGGDGFEIFTWCWYLNQIATDCALLIRAELSHVTLQICISFGILDNCTRCWGCVRHIVLLYTLIFCKFALSSLGGADLGRLHFRLAIGKSETPTLQPKIYILALDESSFAQRLFTLRMAPNLAKSQHTVIEDISYSKLFKANKIADVVSCSPRAIFRIKKNLCCFGSTKALLNSVRQP